MGGAIARAYIGQGTDPYANLAMEESLLHGVGEDEVLLYLWQNAHTIVIGRNQDAWSECRVQAFADAGGRLARRLSGGGAVYHDLGNQNFTFIARAKHYDVEKHRQVIRLATAAFGIEAASSGRNDLLAQGRKFSGNAFYTAGDRCYHHGTLLIDSDMGQLGTYLTPTPEKLARKGVASVQARVVNLKELAPDLSPEAMRGALLEAMGVVYGGPVRLLNEGEVPTARQGELVAHYASEAWRLGQPFPSTAQFAGQLSFGMVDMRLRVVRGRVEKCKVYSDALDGRWVEQIDALMVGVACDERAIAQALAPLFAQEAHHALEMCAWIARAWAHSQEREG